MPSASRRHLAPALLLAVALSARADVPAAKRDLAQVKDSIDSQRWDNALTALDKLNKDLQGVSDADKAPVLAALTEAKANASKTIEADVTKRIGRATGDPSTVSFNLSGATRRLESDEAKAFMEPATIDKLKAKIAAAGGAGAPTPTEAKPEPKPATPSTPLDQDRADLISRIKRGIDGARMGVDRGPDEVESRLKRVEADLKNLPPADQTPLLVEIESVRKQANAQANAGEVRRIEGSIRGAINFAEEEVVNWGATQEDLARATAELDSEEATKYLEPATIQKFRARVEQVRRVQYDSNKKNAFARAGESIKEVEDQLAADPLKKDFDSRKSDELEGELDTLLVRAHDQLRMLYHDDPDLLAFEKHEADLQKRIDALIAAATKAREDHYAAQMAALDAKQKAEAQAALAAEKASKIKWIGESWERTKDEAKDWRGEEPKVDPKKLTDDVLPNTAKAIKSFRYFLGGSGVREAAEKYKDDAALSSTIAEAQKAMDDATAKLNGAFGRLMDELEKLPPPRNQYDFTRPIRLSHDAADWFAGTKYAEPNAARAKAAQDKWEAAVAAREKQNKETYQRLSDAASAAWPAMESASGAQKFTASDAAALKGKTVLIKGVWNRQGWDYDGKRYDFAVRIDGVNVAGNYSDAVNEAFKSAIAQTHLDVDDHKNWDLIATVEGTGQIAERHNDEIRFSGSSDTIKVESYVDAPCVVIRIVGLHAGPIACPAK